MGSDKKDDIETLLKKPVSIPLPKNKAGHIKN
jgi:hypothetical protein